MSVPERRASDAHVQQLEAKVDSLTEQVKELTDNFTALKTSIDGVVAIINTATGAFKVLELLGKLAKPIAWITAATIGIATFLAKHKS